MAKYLVTFNEQTSDIELNGFIVMTEKEVKNFEKLAESITWYFTYKIGDFEVEFSSGEDLLSRLDFKTLTKEQEITIEKLFNNKFGTFIDEDYLTSIIGDEEEIEEFDEDSSDDYDYDSDDDDY